MKPRTLLQKILIGLVTMLLLLWVAGRLMDAHRRHRGALAIIRIEGPIMNRTAASPWSNSGADKLADTLRQLADDADVKAIVLRINSPGGSVGSVQEIDQEVARCRTKGKIVVASLGDVAASGGYYLAAGSNHIVANPGTITGSIGVILEFGNLEGLFQKVGVKLEVIKSGPHKDIGSPARPLTAEEKRMLQDSINDAYDQFFEAVRSGRHLSAEKLKPLADGRIFTGRQALQAGLVDELGNQEVAVQSAIRLANLPKTPYMIREPAKNFASLLEAITPIQSPLASLADAAGVSVEYRWAP